MLTFVYVRPATQSYVMSVDRFIGGCAELDGLGHADDRASGVLSVRLLEAAAGGALCAKGRVL